jgi:hypothetical protein
MLGPEEAVEVGPTHPRIPPPATLNVSRIATAPRSGKRSSLLGATMCCGDLPPPPDVCEGPNCYHPPEDLSWRWMFPARAASDEFRVVLGEGLPAPRNAIAINRIEFAQARPPSGREAFSCVSLPRTRFQFLAH